MSSQKNKTLFVNISIFVVLLFSWWAIGTTVAREAVQNDGRFFEANSSLLANAYYNDWLPVITAAAFGLGWGAAVFVVSLNKTNRRLLTFEILFLILGIPVLCFPVILGIRNSNPLFANNFIDPSSPLFLYGVLNGMLFGLLRRFEKESDD